MLYQFDVPLDEAGSIVSHVVLGAQLHHVRLNLAVAVSGHPGVEVVLYLELESAVEPVHPFGAVDVHGSFQLQVPPLTLDLIRLIRMPVKSVHIEMRQRNLHMQHARYKVRHQNVPESFVRRQADNKARVPGEKASKSGDF